MPETEMIKWVLQMGMGGIFFWLFWTTNQRLQDQDEKHDQNIRALYEMRIQELKLLARLPTDLDGSIPARPQKTIVVP